MAAAALAFAWLETQALQEISFQYLLSQSLASRFPARHAGAKSTIALPDTAVGVEAVLV